MEFLVSLPEWLAWCAAGGAGAFAMAAVARVLAAAVDLESS